MGQNVRERDAVLVCIGAQCKPQANRLDVRAATGVPVWALTLAHIGPTPNLLLTLLPPCTLPQAHAGSGRGAECMGASNSSGAGRHGTWWGPAAALDAATHGCLPLPRRSSGDGTPDGRAACCCLPHRRNVPDGIRNWGVQQYDPCGEGRGRGGSRAGDS